MKSHNRPRREKRTTKAQGQAFAERKLRNLRRRKAILRVLLSAAQQRGQEK